MKVLILILILLFIVFNFKDNFKDSDLFNGDKWDKYRIGDVVLMDINSKHYTKNYYDSVLYHEDKYPGTIASEYMIRNKPLKNKNFKLLKEIIEERKKNFNYNFDNTLFLHIRTGDVICMNNDIKKIYSKVNNKEWWDNVVKYINKNNINSIIILSGSHYNKCLKESKNYLEDRSDFLKSKIENIKIDYHIGQSPDDDILLISNSKHFISTGGGYGELLSKIILK